MKIEKIEETPSVDEACSVPVPEGSIDVPRLTQFSPGAG